MKALLVVMVVCDLTKKLSNGSPVDYWSENFDAGNYKHFCSVLSGVVANIIISFKGTVSRDFRHFILL